jgi:hypothetical protein
VRTTAPTAMSAINILDLVIRASRGYDAGLIGPGVSVGAQAQLGPALRGVNEQLDVSTVNLAVEISFT